MCAQKENGTKIETSRHTGTQTGQMQLAHRQAYSSTPSYLIRKAEV